MTAFERGKLAVGTAFYAVSLGMSGCAKIGIDSEWSMTGDGRATDASANQIIDKTFETVDEPKLINMFIGPYTVNKNKTLEDAFREANLIKDANEGKTRRNALQDRLFAISEQRCNFFFTHIRRLSTYQELTFGTLSTILGGAGAIVTGAAAARGSSWCRWDFFRISCRDEASIIS